jgi:hypothetical protein
MPNLNVFNFELSRLVSANDENNRNISNAMQHIAIMRRSTGLPFFHFHFNFNFCFNLFFHLVVKKKQLVSD